jgi:hypothetical protein
MTEAEQDREDAITDKALDRLEAQPRRWHMTLDDEVLECPGCRQGIYEYHTRTHAMRCTPLREEVARGA